MLKGQATIYVRLKGQARIYVKRSGNNLCQMVWQQFISKGYAPPPQLRRQNVPEGGGKDPFVTVPRQCPTLYTKRAIICSVILSPPKHTHTHPASVPYLVYIYIYIYVMDIQCFWGLYPTVPRLRGYTVGYSTKTHSISNIYPILPPNGTTSTTRENVCINLTVKLIFICTWNLKHFGWVVELPIHDSLNNLL